MTLIEALELFAAQFQRKTRDNGSEFICLRDGAPCPPSAPMAQI